jgi:hypothetical protein
LNNKIKIYFKVLEFNGYPSVKISLDDQLLVDHTFSNSEWEFQFDQEQTQRHHCLQIERYGKTDLNYSPEQDQIVEIKSITVDNIPIPQYILDKQSQFLFNDQVHVGSLYFGPNGIWTWNFGAPIITHLLDQKIQHEAQYNQDYIYPWAYKLGPDSVNTILSNIEGALNRVHQL